MCLFASLYFFVSRSLSFTINWTCACAYKIPVNLYFINIFIWIIFLDCSPSLWLLTFLLTVWPIPSSVALTPKVAGIELSLIRLGRHTREEHVTRVGASPDAAPVALAEFEAAAAGVSRQGPDEGTQDSVKVVPEEAALALGRFGEKQSGLHVRNAHRCTRTEHFHECCTPQIWRTASLPTAPRRRLPALHSLPACASGPSAHTAPCVFVPCSPIKLEWAYTCVSGSATGTLPR